MYKKLVSAHFAKKNDNLCLLIPDPCVVYFKGSTTPRDSAFLRVFNEVSRESSGTGIKFFVVVVDENEGRRVVVLSNGTKTNIVTTPTVIFYMGGFAKTKYAGNDSKVNFSNFIEQMVNMTQSQQQFQEQAQQTQQFQQQSQQFPQRRGMYATLGGEDNSIKLSSPEDIVPWNTPWDSSYKKLEFQS